MISRSELQRLAKRQKVALGTLEKDYILTEVLKSLSEVPSLRDMLVFKGGTALRKVYFSHWRYSEDLDFTVRENLTESQLSKALGEWYAQVERESQIQLTTKMLHKPDGYARIRTQFVGPLFYPGMIFMDLSFDELLCLAPQSRRLVTAPFPDSEREVLAYPLEELLAEKIRSLLERGKSRDYYDVWRLLKEQPSKLDFALLGTVLLKKMTHKGLTLHYIGDFLPKDTRGLRRYWEEDLQQQVTPLPSLDAVLEELREMLRVLVSPHLTFKTDDI